MGAFWAVFEGGFGHYDFVGPLEAHWGPESGHPKTVGLKRAFERIRTLKMTTVLRKILSFQRWRGTKLDENEHQDVSKSIIFNDRGEESKNGCKKDVAPLDFSTRNQHLANNGPRKGPRGR